MLQTVHKAERKLGSINIDELCKRYGRVCFLNSNSAYQKADEYDFLLGVGSSSEIIVQNEKGALQKLQDFLDHNKTWVFGYMSYDLKNDLEELESPITDLHQFPSLHFFSAQFVLHLKNGILSLIYDDAEASLEDAEHFFAHATNKTKTAALPFHGSIQTEISKEEYTAVIYDLKNHIQKGDIYEINYCSKFFAENASTHPAAIYEDLNNISQAPFSSFLKSDRHYLLSSSPERFLKKTGNELLSQPIKGTKKRSEYLPEDEDLRKSLQEDEKERAENIMIVDLVRNDFSKIAERGSVEVRELCGIYSFRQVHQLISTIACTLPDSVTFLDIISATFPMGSMTGAPKVRAMQLIDKFEKSKRGLYSGALGYIDPKGNFDLSVVIRSILYSIENKSISYSTGSAITADSNAEQEFEECMLKANAFFDALKVSRPSA